MNTNVPKSSDGETVWSKWLAAQMNGIAEYTLPDRSRVDILTPTLAIEVDWVKKWAEAIGQAIYYGVVTERQPAILLLLRSKPTEKKYLLRAKRSAEELNIPVFTWTTKFSHEYEKEL